MTKLDIVKTVFLKAPREHVWKFLTEADKLALWFHRGENDLEEGGGYRINTNSHGQEGEKMIDGKVLEMDPPNKLVHTFTHDWLKGVETVCTWTLVSAEGGTVLTLVHTGWEKVEEGAFDMAANHDSGWDEHFARFRVVMR